MKNSSLARPGNKSAAKPPENRLDARINLPCAQRDKTLWVNEAQRNGMLLSQWIRATLNDKADPDPTPWCSRCGAMEAANCSCPPDADFVEDIKRLAAERAIREAPPVNLQAVAKQADALGLATGFILQP